MVMPDATENRTISRTSATATLLTGSHRDSLGDAWRRTVLMDQLPLVVVFRRLEPVRSSNRLSRFVCFEAGVQRSLPRCERRVTYALVGQHQVVVGIQVLGIN